MYNDPNVQPQVNNTGHGGFNSGEPMVFAPAVSPNELPSPAPVEAGHGQVVPTLPNPPSVQTPQQAPQGNENWASEVEQLFDRTTQSPRQRAEEFSELRQHYQQQVLGIKPMGRET
jgi:hypothetical protein